MRKSQVSGAIALACAGAMVLAGCGAGQHGAADRTPPDQKVTLTVWTGNTTPTQAAAKLFEKDHPNVTVKVETVTDAYKALDNAIQAGTGIPNVMEFEYITVPYFAIQNKIEDLGRYGAKNDGTFVDGAWQDVSFGGKPYAVPMDYGPTVMFYNQDTLAKAGVAEAPKTWDEFYEAAKKVHALGDNYHIINDAGDIFTMLSLIWQAGGRPFTVDGTKITVNVKDEGTKRAVGMWQRMIDEGLIATDIMTWSDDWNRALNDGTIATQIIGGWLTSSIADRAPLQSGKFRVAPMPQWKAGDNVGAENGGSGFAIPSAAKNKDVAWEFLQYMAYDDAGVQARVDAGVFPPNVKVLKDAGFLSATNPYFGDQKYREVIADAASHVAAGWQYLPFMEKARYLYVDNMDYTKVSPSNTLQGLLDAWAGRIVDYGNKQGFDVSE